MSKRRLRHRHSSQIGSDEAFEYHPEVTVCLLFMYLQPAGIVVMIVGYNAVTWKSSHRCLYARIDPRHRSDCNCA